MGGARPLEMDEYSLVVGATVAYFLMWYGFLCHQMIMRGSASQRAESKGINLTRFDYRFADWEMADRTLLNAQEQMVPFLLPMWLYAVFCNPHAAGVLGYIYVLFRFLYPIFWSVNGRFSILVEISTQPNYMVQGWFIMNLLYMAVTGTCMQPASALMWPLYLIASWAVFMIGSWIMTGGVLVK